MNYFIALFLAIIPYSIFIFREINNLWQVQGYFVQLCILILFSLSYIKKPLRCVNNKALGFLILAIGLNVLYFQSIALSQSGYSNSVFSFFNFICIVIFYNICVQYLNKEGIERCLKFLKYSALVMIAFSIFQKFGFAQFIKQIELPAAHHAIDNAMTGFIGHPTHYAGYLGMMMPLFFGRKRENILAVILVWILLLFYTNYSTEVSSTGLLVGLGVCSYYFYQINKRLFFTILALLLIVGVVLYQFIPKELIGKLIYSTGRVEIWSSYFEISKGSWITGRGLGFVRLQKEYFKHLHNEFFQIYLEAGIGALLATLYCVIEFFRVKVKTDKTVLQLKAIFIGFLIYSLFVYPAHLWVISTIAIFCYASIYALHKEEIDYAHT